MPWRDFMRWPVFRSDLVNELRSARAATAPPQKAPPASQWPSWSPAQGSAPATPVRVATRPAAPFRRRIWQFTSAERSTLSDMVKAPTVSSTREYVAALQEAGFVDVETEDMSSVWQARVRPPVAPCRGARLRRTLGHWFGRRGPRLGTSSL